MLTALIHMMRDAKVSVELGTMEAGPKIVFWELDAYTPDDRAADAAVGK